MDNTCPPSAFAQRARRPTTIRRVTCDATLDRNGRAVVRNCVPAAPVLRACSKTHTGVTTCAEGYGVSGFLAMLALVAVPAVTLLVHAAINKS